MERSLLINNQPGANNIMFFLFDTEIQFHVRYVRSCDLLRKLKTETENWNLSEFQFRSCSEKTVNQNTNVVAEWCKVVHKRTSSLTVMLLPCQ